MRKLYLAAWILGILPLILGIGDLVLWIIWTRDIFMELGLYAIILGWACVAFGTCLLIAYGVGSLKKKLLTGRQLAGRALAILALYAMNFVAFAGCIAGAMYYDSLVRLSITNQADEIVTSVQVQGNDTTNDVGDILPGQIVRCTIMGPVEDMGAVDGTLAGQEISGYIDPEYQISGGNYRITINRDGTIHSEKLPGGLWYWWPEPNATSLE